MSFWRFLSARYEKKEIAVWPSLKKAGYILQPLFLYFFVHDLTEVILWAVINQFMMSRGSVADFLTKNAPTVQGIVNGLMILLGAAAIWGAVKSEILGAESGQDTKEEISVTTKISEKSVTDYAIVAALAFCASVGLNMLFSLSGIVSSSKAFSRTADAQFGVNFIVGLILYGLISPIAEEAVFRGVMYNRMKRCFRLKFALIVSALLFGCYHGNFVQALYGTLLGMMIAYVYETYRSFAAPVLFHAVANISVYVMTYKNSFLDMGMGAGIVTAVVTLTASVICLWIIRKRFAVSSLS